MTSLADNTLVFKSRCPHTSLLHPWQPLDHNPADERSTLLLVSLYLCTGKPGDRVFSCSIIHQIPDVPGPGLPLPWPRLASSLIQACLFLGLGAWGAACIPSLMLCEAFSIGFALGFMSLAVLPACVCQRVQAICTLGSSPRPLLCNHRITGVHTHRGTWTPRDAQA